MREYITPEIVINNFSGGNILAYSSDLTYSALELNGAMHNNEQTINRVTGTVTVRLKTVQNIIQLQ